MEESRQSGLKSSEMSSLCSSLNFRIFEIQDSSFLFRRFRLGKRSESMSSRSDVFLPFVFKVNSCSVGKRKRFENRGPISLTEFSDSEH